MESSVNDIGVVQMKYLKAPQGKFGLFLIFSLFISTSVLAENPLITRHFSGIWDQPEQESQGIILQIGEQADDTKVGIAYWFTYGEDLQTTWYLGVGPVNGNEINMKLHTAFNVEFMGDEVGGNANVEEVGTLDLVFKNCNHGTATFETSEDLIGSGEFPIKRINSIYRTRCSGGISDDTPSNGKPLQLEVNLYPPVEGDSGEGKAKFWERTDRSDFKVEVEDVADGTYTLQICGGEEDPPVDTLEFEMSVAGGEGELKFRSPEIENKLNLNFDPRGCKIELINGAGVVLTSGDEVLNEKQPGKPDKEDEEVVKIEVDMASTGVIESAKGEAELEVWADETEFSVKIKNVPVGFYTVWVAGSNVGEIEVADDGDFDGKLKIIDPSFDPLGKNIKVKQADDQVILEVLFPDE
jgi:hypothetical protein